MNNFDSITKLPGMEEEIANQFVTILSTDDKQFENMYPFLKESIISTYESEAFQDDMIRNLKYLPQSSVEEAEEAIDDFLSAFDSEDISPLKKEFMHYIMDNLKDIYGRILVSGRKIVKIKIVKLNPDAVIPQYAHPTDGGCDVCAVEEVKIEAGETAIIKTGLAVAVPAGYVLSVRPRSGLSAKTKLRVANAPGTIDTDYRGEVGIIIHNTGDVPYVIDKGMKIAQLLVEYSPMIWWNEVETVEDLGTTERGNGGFGSTGNVASAKS